MLNEPHVSRIFLSPDQMYPEWPWVSMQPAGAAELHERKEIWEAERYRTLQLQPVWATYCTEHKTAVRRCCLRGNTCKLLRLVWIFPSVFPATSSSVNWLSDTSTGSHITSWDMSTGNGSRKPFPNVSTEPSAHYYKLWEMTFVLWNCGIQQKRRAHCALAGWCCAHHDAYPGSFIHS